MINTILKILFHITLFFENLERKEQVKINDRYWREK